MNGRTNFRFLTIAFISQAFCFHLFGQSNQIQIADYFRITILNANRNADETIVRFLPQATRGFDSDYDAYKLPGGFVNISTMPDSTLNLSINSMPFPVVSDSLRIRFTNASGNLRFVFTNLDSFLGNLIVMLKDGFTGTKRVIQNNDTIPFTVTANPNTSGKRFTLVFFYPPITDNSKISRAEETYNFKTKIHAQIPFNNLSQVQQMDWFSLDGRMLHSKTNKDLLVPSLAPGLYFLRLKYERPVLVRVMIER